MAHFITEEDWNNFSFRILTEEDLPAIDRHLTEHFYDDEPLNYLVGRSEEKEADTSSFIRRIIGEHLSFAAIDKNTGQIAGLRITFKHMRDLNVGELNFSSAEMQVILSFCMVPDQLSQIFDRYGVEEYADCLILSVARGYRRLGLATEMARRALQFLKAMGFQVVKGIYTSPYSRKAALKNGYEVLATRYFRELTTLTGEFICPDAGDDEKAVIMAKRL